MKLFQWLTNHFKSGNPNSSQISYTAVTEEKRVLVIAFINLLRRFATEIEKLKPTIEWGNYQELTNRLTTIVNQIEQELDEGRLAFNFNDFFFSHFNGKSPQGEVWSYLSWAYDNLKELDAQIHQKWEEIIRLERS